MRANRGIALLLVLWALVLLGTLALGFSLSMRTEAMAARNGIDETRAWFQARTGVSRTVALLASRSADNVLAASIAGEDGDVSYAIRGEERGRRPPSPRGGAHGVRADDRADHAAQREDPGDRRTDVREGGDEGF